MSLVRSLAPCSRPRLHSQSRWPGFVCSTKKSELSSSGDSLLRKAALMFMARRSISRLKTCGERYVEILPITAYQTKRAATNNVSSRSSWIPSSGLISLLLCSPSMPVLSTRSMDQPSSRHSDTSLCEPMPCHPSGNGYPSSSS